MRLRVDQTLDRLLPLTSGRPGLSGSRLGVVDVVDRPGSGDLGGGDLDAVGDGVDGLELLDLGTHALIRRPLSLFRCLSPSSASNAASAAV